jgi:uncharacterized membrane protein (UPF0182 family)
MQIEARVDQQTEISRELSLWGQRGSRVIRGNLLAIPVGDTFIYVEPVYLEAKQEESDLSAAGSRQQKGFARPQSKGMAGSSQQDKSKAASLPELKRVIVAFSNRVIMEENLDKALSGVLGAQISPKGLASPSIAPAQDLSDLGVLALEHYNRAKDYLRQGNWAEYGRELESLERILKEMSRTTKENKR